MSRQWLIGADVGSSCLKAAAVHPEQGVVAISEEYYPMHRPHPGWAQNDPEDWYQALALAVPAALAQAGISASDVAALCLVGQRDIAVLTDEAGHALAPVIHWTDRRDPAETTAVYERLGSRALIDITGTLPIPGLVLPNLLWTRRHQPDLWHKVRHALQPKDYLAHRLTGDLGTDPTGPTRSILNDWRTGTWSEDLCDVYGIPRELLPEVKYQPWQVRGELGAIAHEIGLAPGTLLVAGGGDDPAAALGSGVIDPGHVSVGTGSSMSWRAVAERPMFDPTGIVGLMPHVVPDRHLHEMVAVGSGTTLRWLRGAFGGTATYEELIAATDEVGPGSDGLLCFPYIEGASVPVQDDHVRAVFHGISGHHGLPHFVRSTLEGIAYQYPVLLTALTDRGLHVTDLTISDGEARSTTWNQIKADVLGRSLTPALRVEAPSIGAAILAGIGAGVFATAREGVDAVVEVSLPIQPTPGGYTTYQELRRHWERSRDQVFPQLTGHTLSLH
ncbi:FGGY-family carbohydrate kinase [Streptomyces longwoodensis]|uniref:xylulokinase n=1 Tax=Streptomyces longwoodensis TaxID=68231 RepID=UPI0036F50830